MANLPPTPPTDVRIGRIVPGGPDPAPVAVSDGMSTKSTGGVVVTAQLNDPNTGDQIRMMVRLSANPKFAGFVDQKSDFVASGQRAEVRLHGLKQNVHYYIRCYAQDEHGVFARSATPPHHYSFASANFWTNQAPNTPVLTVPAENATILTSAAITFTWTFSDPDPGDVSHEYQLRWRTAPTATQPPGAYTTIGGTPSLATSLLVAAGTFLGGRNYEWQVRANDGHLWSAWSDARSFYSLGTTTPPVPLTPALESAVDATLDTLFTWKFVDHEPNDAQKRADLRWRLVGQDDSSWITTLGAVAPGIPGAAKSWLIAAGTFAIGDHYEWQVRTYDTLSALQSSWSTSAFFYAITTPGQVVTEMPPVMFPTVQGSLGCGTYRVFIYDQGGQVPRGEIDPLSSLTFSRKRDDISTAVITTNGFGEDCCLLYANMRCWAHEIVIFRDGVRVWEGPITRLTYQVDSVQIEARDVMAYLYRRIMRQGFNDSYQIIGGVQQGLHTVVERAQLITVNALAPHDPNVLPYLTALSFDDDARQTRVVADYVQTAWEQIDDLASNAGLDYTAIGRRIVYNDTHRAIGRLPEMRDGDFDSPPIVTEYGMQMANYSAVTTGTGIWGAATPAPLAGQDPFIYYGPVEVLNSSFQDSSAIDDGALTPAARAALIRNLEAQAERNINHRWPTPVVVRVQDNSTLNPNVGVTFDQLVPGVWIPLRSTGTCRQVSQWQKLDSVTVTDDDSGEKISVVMSPAPNGGDDPDASAAEDIVDV